MDYENQLMRMILIYCDNNKIEIGADEAWELAKKIASMPLLKTRGKTVYERE